MLPGRAQAESLGMVRPFVLLRSSGRFLLASVPAMFLDPVLAGPVAAASPLRRTSTSFINTFQSWASGYGSTVIQVGSCYMLLWVAQALRACGS